MMHAEPWSSRVRWSVASPDAELSAISDVRVDPDLSRLVPNKKNYYRKRNGKLYRFRYRYVDGKLVYSEEEVTDLIVNDIESHLKMSLHDGEQATLEQTADATNEQVIVIDGADLRDHHSIMTEWAKIKNPSAISVGQGRPQRAYAPSYKIVAGRGAPSPSKSSVTTKTNKGVNRGKGGKVTKPVHTSRAKKGLLIIGMSAKGRQMREKPIEEAEAEFETDVKVPAPMSPEMLQNLMFIRMYNDIDDIREKAEELEIGEALEAESMPVIDGLTESDWEGITAFDDLAKGLLLDGEMTYAEFRNWMEKKRALRKKTFGLYSSKADSYVDLCLQYMALKHCDKVLFMDWDYYIESLGNHYIHVQQFFMNNPGASWDDLCREDSHLVTGITNDIEQASNENVAVIRDLLRKASRLDDAGFPEYLFAGREIDEDSD